MEVKDLTLDCIDKLYDMYEYAYPQKPKEEVKRYVDHWLAKEPDCSKFYVVQFEGDEIVGMNAYSPMSYFFNGEEKKSFWGFDLKVKREYRKLAYGVDVLLYCRKNYPITFSTGSGPLAMKLLNKLKVIQIGEIRKYFKCAYPFFTINSFFKSNIDACNYPQKIEIFGQTFKNTDKNELPNLTSPYFDTLLEFSRKNDFLTWKFFENLHQYAFYLNSETNSYFVVRVIRRHHMSILMLTDFRFSPNRPNDFDVIIKAVNLICRKLKIAIIYSCSSLKVTDNIFDKYGYKVIGRNRPIITFDKEYKKNDYVEKIKNRDLVFVTLSDSDGEPM